jgi:hypothetical protein
LLATGHQHGHHFGHIHRTAAAYSNYAIDGTGLSRLLGSRNHRLGWIRRYAVKDKQRITGGRENLLDWGNQTQFDKSPIGHQQGSPHAQLQTPIAQPPGLTDPDADFPNGVENEAGHQNVKITLPLARRSIIAA